MSRPVRPLIPSIEFANLVLYSRPIALATLLHTYELTIRNRVTRVQAASLLLVQFAVAALARYWIHGTRSLFFYSGQTRSYDWSVYSYCCKKNTTDPVRLVGPNKRTSPHSLSCVRRTACTCRDARSKQQTWVMGPWHADDAVHYLG